MQGARVAMLPDLANLSSEATAVRSAVQEIAQSSNEILMVAPTAFGFNEQAAQVITHVSENHQCHHHASLLHLTVLAHAHKCM